MRRNFLLNSYPSCKNLSVCRRKGSPLDATEKAAGWTFSLGDQAPRRRLAEHDAHVVRPAVVDERNRRRVDGDAVERGRRGRRGTAARGSTRRSGTACPEPARRSRTRARTTGCRDRCRTCRRAGAGRACSRGPRDTSTPPTRCTSSSRRGRRAAAGRRRRRRRRTAPPCSAATSAGVRVWLIGLSMWNSSATSSPLPSRASAMTTQAAACVYWPPFSRTPGG